MSFASYMSGLRTVVSFGLFDGGSCGLGAGLTSGFGAGSCPGLSGGVSSGDGWAGSMGLGGLGLSGVDCVEEAGMPNFKYKLVHEGRLLLLPGCSNIRDVFRLLPVLRFLVFTNPPHLHRLYLPSALTLWQ